MEDYLNTSKFILLFTTIIELIIYHRTKAIPNWLTFGTAFAGLVIAISTLTVSNICNSIAGMLLGVALFIAPYLYNGLGAGCVKFLGSIGAIVGYKGILIIFLYNVVIGVTVGILWIFMNPEHLKSMLTKGKVPPTANENDKVPYGHVMSISNLIYCYLM